jgi:glycosyltransferase involved in cell wall biosynthesis
MNNENLVSVIITSYNQGKYLNDSIESLLNQSYKNWECIIINDGSEDDTEKIALHYSGKDSRISYQFQINQGVAPARNLGISKAKGDFIQFLDADDYLHPGKFSHQISVLINHPQIDMLFGSSRYFFDRIPDVFYPLHPNGGIPCDLTYRDGFQVEMLLKNNICSNCALLMRRKVIEKIKFREVIYEDWIFNLECALNGFVFHFDNALDSYSYIRMTSSSQMMKHTRQISNLKKFDSLLLKLVKESDYKISEEIVNLDELSNGNSIKKFIRSLTPPIIYSTGAIIKRKLFS